MNASGVPVKFSLVWAATAGSSYARQPPFPPQSGGTASFSTGFPPDTFIPVGSGGIPPDGRDVNGVLQMLSQWAQWFQAGAPLFYDSAFSSSIGGYPAGAVLTSLTTGRVWLNLADGNTSNPDTGGANWINPALGYRTRLCLQASRLSLCRLR